MLQFTWNFQVDETLLISPTDDTHVFKEPDNFVILRCVDPKTSELLFCPHSHIFRYSRLGDRSIVAIIATLSLITLILSIITILFLVHSLCDGVFSEKFMILVNHIASLKFIWLFDWMIDVVMIGIGILLFPIIEPHDLFSPKRNPYARFDPAKVHRLFPMLLGANIGQSLGGIAAAFSISAPFLYKLV